MAEDVVISVKGAVRVRSTGLGQTILSHSIPAAHAAAVIFIINKLIIYFGYFFPLTCFQVLISFNITGRISDLLRSAFFPVSMVFFLLIFRRRDKEENFPIAFSHFFSLVTMSLPVYNSPLQPYYLSLVEYKYFLFT